MDAVAGSNYLIDGSSHQFICTACQVSFPTLESQRAHTQTDWHVYNLKRRITTLQPLSLEVFKEQVQAVAASVALGQGKEFMETCALCERSFYSLKSWQTHCKAPSHLKRVGGTLPERVGALDIKDPAQHGEPEEKTPQPGLENVNTSTDAELPLSECLFCVVEFPDLSRNVVHMHKVHGLFIPDQEYLIDLETFVSYLYTIISVFHECLYCGSAKSTTEATRSHMRDRGHCMLNFEAETELGMFWERSDDDDDDSGMESGSDSQLAPKTSLTAETTLQGDENNLRLASGKVLGHRFQPRSFRSHIGPNRRSRSQGVNTQRKAITDGSTSNGTTSDPRTGRQVATRANGGSGLIGVPQLERRALMAREKMMMKAEIRARNLYERGVEKASNRTGQKHYKPDVPGRRNG